MCFAYFVFQLIYVLRRIFVHFVFYVAPQKIVTWGSIRRARRPWNWSIPAYLLIRQLSIDIFSYFKVVVRRSATLLKYHVFRVVLKLGKQKIAQHSLVGTASDVFVFKKVRSYYSTFWHSAPDHNRWRAVKCLVYSIRALSTPDSAILLVHLSGQQKLTFVGEIIRSRYPVSFLSSVRQFWAN